MTIKDEAGRELATVDDSIVGYVRPTGPWDDNFFAPAAEKKIVSVCAWCPDNREKTAEAKANGFNVSHTICAHCDAQLKRQERSA